MLILTAAAVHASGHNRREHTRAPARWRRRVGPGQALSNDLGADHALGWGRMSALLIPATTTGFFIASRRNRSRNFWFTTASMKVVPPSFICSFTAVRSASVSRKTGHRLTRHTSAGLLGAHPVMPRSPA